MPGCVVRFIGKLPANIGAGRKLVILAQSGFPETGQFTPLLRYLETLPGRLGFNRGGIIAKGFGSSIESLPRQLVEGDLEKLESLGCNVGRAEELDGALVESLAQPISLNAKWLIVFKLLRAVGLLNSFTRKQVRANHTSLRSIRAQPLIRGE
jgi:hypothetical protein